MSNFASQSSLLNLAPKPDVKVVQASLNDIEGESGFLASLVQAIDESNGFLPQNLQITQKEIMQEQKTQKNSLLGDTEQKSSLFDSLSFVQVLGVLENLQIQNSEIKLANLSKPLQEFVQTQSNLDALKGAKNLDELLKIAKNLNLEVSNVKIDKIFELKTAFPNLDKANFFSTKLESAFKDFLNTKISKIIKENEGKFNHLHSKPKVENTTTLLSKLLQNVSKDGDDTPLLNNNELKNVLQKSLEIINEGEELKLNKFTPKEPEKVLSSLKVLSENTQKDLNPKTLNLKTEMPNITQATKETPLTDFKEPINLKELVKEAKPHLPKDENKPTQKLTQAVEIKANPEIQSKVASTTNELINQINKELKKEVKKEPNKELKNSEKSPIKTLIDETMKELKSVESEKISKIPLNNDEKIPLKNQIKNDEKPVKAEFSPKNEPLQELKLNAKSKKNSPENVDFAKQENKEFKTQTTKENVILANSQNQAESKIENKISTENKIKTSENLNLNQNITNKPMQTEQRSYQNESNFIASDDKSELNSLIKDLSQVSRAELKSEVNVRETFTRFAQDLKEQIQHYKPPITRFNITLNPSNLGEVEVTLIQRGSNLHINFNSNTTAMNLFIQNQAEFKNSLVNMGFTGLEMNFSDQSKKDRQQQGKSRSGYGFKEELKMSENSTLEMILARYF